MAQADVSVVIAAYNEEAHLATCLRSLAGQIGVCEVIVVDDGSTDATAAIGRGNGARVIMLEHGGPARARNVGVEAAQGELIVFLDGDMSAGQAFVERLVAPIRDGQARGTFSKELYLANAHNKWAAAYAALRGHGTDRIIPPEFPDRWENFRAISREAFVSVGGYDDVGYGGDMTVAPKLGELALAAPGAVCFHSNPDSLAEIRENARWIGRGQAIDAVPHPWIDNSPPVALWRGLRDLASGRTPWVVPARLCYHAWVLVGLVERRLLPARRPYK